MAHDRTHLKHWWMPLIASIIFLILGILFFLLHVTAYTELTIPLVIGFMLVGGFRTYYARRNHDNIGYPAIVLINGVLELCILLIAILPFVAIAEYFPVFIGFLLLFRSIIGIGIAFNFYYAHFLGWIIIIIGSIAGLLGSFMTIWDPVSSGSEILIYPALTFLIIGVTQFTVSMGLKKLNNKVQVKADLR